MKTSECIEYFGSLGKIAEAIGLRAPSLYDWGEYPPPLRQLQIEALTGRKLIAEQDCFETRKASA